MNRKFATIVAGFLLTLAFSPSVAAEARRCGASSLFAPHPRGAFRSQDEERIDINTASVEELGRLPGVGPVLASRIAEHRRKHGPFKRPQDIIIVRGMSAKLYRRIAHLIRV
jgi:competence ComEA-like helix-hairpin-helix protein